MDAAIEVRGLEKVYKGSRKQPDKRALESIDLTIPAGSIFGLLGPNGAGKSTFINILAGLVNKTAGTCRVWGFDIDTNPRNAKASIGVVPQELFFDAFFTPFEVLELQAGLYGVPKAERRTDEILEMVRLSEQRDAYSRTLSGGMKRRLLIAKAMVHSPPILILDEPTAGVDIELRQQLWDNVRDLHAQGVTIVLTTHYLEEAEELCDEIAIINHGAVAVCEKTESLLRRIDEKEVIVETASDITTLPPALQDFDPRREGARNLVFHTSREGDSMRMLLRALADSDLDIVDFSTDETDLEDIFLQLTRG